MGCFVVFVLVACWLDFIWCVVGVVCRIFRFWFGGLFLCKFVLGLWIGVMCVFGVAGFLACGGFVG